jgi:hypothetical protein
MGTGSRGPGFRGIAAPLSVPDARWRHRGLCQPERAPVPRRPGSARGGGTPAIVEVIRAGLVFQLKQLVGVDVIRSHEEHYLQRAINAWLQEPSIEMLGYLETERRSIVSFVVGTERAISAPQLRRRPAQRPVRDPVPWRLLLRGSLRTSAAGHRLGPLARLRPRNRSRL